MTEEELPKPYDLEVPLAAGRDEAWDAVTQSPVLHQWFGWDYAGLAAEIQHIFVDEATLVAPERMGWPDGSWLEVTGDDDTSTVRVVAAGSPVVDADRYDAMEQGWQMFLTQLQFLLGARPEGARRTLRLTGETTGRQALGLVDGEWHRFGRRVAWVADPDGNLVVVAGHAHLDSPDAALTSVTVSTYGLDDAVFTANREDWRKRWASIAADAAIVFGGLPSH